MLIDFFPIQRLYLISHSHYKYNQFMNVLKRIDILSVLSKRSTNAIILSFEKVKDYSM